jgi:hypothetical protein
MIYRFTDERGVLGPQVLSIRYKLLYDVSYAIEALKCWGFKIVYEVGLESGLEAWPQSQHMITVWAFLIQKLAAPIFDMVLF